jgi:RNA polymerase sigma-70 factor, ECF subfamily
MPPIRGMRPDPHRDHASSIEPEAPFSVRLDAARDGKVWALTALYRSLHSKLLRYVAAREPRFAEAVTEEVWRDVSRGLQTFDGTEAEFTAWTFALARRQLVKARELAPDEADDDDASLARFDQRTQSALRCLAGLPDDEADVFLLRAIAGLTTEEVAWIVGKPRGAVHALQQRAIEHLVRRRAHVTELVA